MLAQRWQSTWVDTDDLLALTVREPVADHLRRVSEPAFRSAEFSVLRTALAQYDVVATGGGVVATSEARQVLVASATVWLDCDDEIILARVEDGDRPLLGDDHAAALARLRATRTPWYAAVSRARVDASGTLEDVSSRVQEALAELER